MQIQILFPLWLYTTLTIGFTAGQLEGNVPNTTTNSLGVETQTPSLSTTDSLAGSTGTPTDTTVNGLENSTTTETTTVTSTTLAPETTISPVLKYQGFGECSCDLTANGCDVNCCCDADCSNADISSFSVDCTTQARVPDGYHSESCFADGIIIRNSSPLPSYRLPSGSLCLIYDNNPQRLFYQEPAVLTTPADFDAPWRARGINSSIFAVSLFDSEITQLINRNASQPVFKVGDPIFVLRKSDLTVGKLQFPSAGPFSSRCIAPQSVGFLQAADSACSYTVDSLAVECTTNQFYQLSNLMNQSVVRSAEIFVAVNSSTGSLTNFGDLTDNSLLSLTVPVQLGNISIRGVDGNVQSVAVDANSFATFAPSFSDTTQTCTNVVTEVSYLFFHEGPTITSAQLSVILAPVLKGGGSFEQRYHLDFLPATSQSAPTFARSGNPGYVEGSAILVTSATDSLMTAAGLVQADMLTLPGVGPSGLCSQSSLTAVSFGENLQMSCIVMIDIQNPETACQTLQDKLDSAMLNGGRVPTNVSVYGNGTLFSSEGWIPVASLPASGAVSFLFPKTCSHIVTALSIEVAYAQVGFLSNPQSKITGVLYRFLEPSDVVLECPFHGCANGSLISVEMQFAVSFFDYSQSAVDLRSLQPPASRFLPADFFTPY